jgi:hypothetical protein
MAVQLGTDEVILSFFETFIPYLVDPTEADRERLREVGIPAECIARVTVSKRRFHEFAELMMKTSEQLRMAESKAESTPTESEPNQ